MTFNADVERAIALGASDAKQHIAICQLSAIQRDTGTLIDRARQQLGGAGYAAAISATVRQADALAFQAVEQAFTAVNRKCLPVPVCQRDVEGVQRAYVQMSEVQSPPG